MFVVLSCCVCSLSLLIVYVRCRFSLCMFVVPSRYVCSLSLLLVYVCCPFSLCMFIVPSWNIDSLRWMFLQNYFLLLKNKEYLAPHSQIAEFLFSSILCKPNTYKTCWIHSKVFEQTGVAILSTCAKFHHTSVTRMREKNWYCYFWSAPLSQANCIQNVCWKEKN